MSESNAYVPSFLSSTTPTVSVAHGGVPPDESFWNSIVHPEDRQAIAALESIPALASICKAIHDKAIEKYARMAQIGGGVRLGVRQMPKLYGLLVDVCDAFGMREIPEFYLQMDRSPNAYTQGESHPMITITSGLAEIMSDDDIRTVLAHECGHILFHHLRYKLAARLVFAGVNSTLGRLANLAAFGSLSALEQCIYRWERMSEYSADRAALLFTGNVKKALRVQMLLAGGLRELPDAIDLDEYVRQAEDFSRMFRAGDAQGWLGNLSVMGMDHPYTSDRCLELVSFGRRSDFKVAAQRLGTYSCPQCGGRMRSMTMCENGHFC